MPLVEIDYDKGFVLEGKMEEVAIELSKSIAVHWLNGDKEKDANRVKVVWRPVIERSLNMPSLSIRISAGKTYAFQEGDLDRVLLRIKKDLEGNEVFNLFPKKDRILKISISPSALVVI